MNREAFWKVEVNPCAGGPKSKFFVQEYISLGNGKSGIGGIIFIGTYQECCSMKEKLDKGEMDRDDVWTAYREKLFQNEESIYSIYQLKDGMRDRVFMSLNWIRDKGIPVNRKCYRMVYIDRLTGKDGKNMRERLENIYIRFNIEHPADYRGRSFSVSDVVVIRKDGQEKAYYCDTVGFEEVPEFVAGEN